MRSLARVGVSSLARVPRPPAVRTSLRFLSAELPPSVRLALKRTVRFRRTAVELANRLEEADELSDELREELMQVILWQRCTRISKVSVFAARRKRPKMELSLSSTRRWKRRVFEASWKNYAVPSRT